jgi:hypothetical protein
MTNFGRRIVSSETVSFSFFSFASNSSSPAEQASGISSAQKLGQFRILGNITPSKLSTPAAKVVTTAFFLLNVGSWFPSIVTKSHIVALDTLVAKDTC